MNIAFLTPTLLSGINQKRAEQMASHDIYIPENEIDKLRVKIETLESTVASLSREKFGLLESIQKISADKNALLTKLEVGGTTYSEATVDAIRNEYQQRIDELLEERTNDKKMIALLNKIIELSGIMSHD